MVQDAVQECYWSSDQVTLHPVVFMPQPVTPYKPKPVSLCIVSDCITYATNTFNGLQKVVVQYMKTLHSKIKNILYFSNVAASQHRNKKNSTNLVNHDSKFGITAEWHFFTTSHGSSPCYAVGGTTT
jgi:hypothetical protein